MAGWLSRATDAFRKPAPLPPEPFSVRCDCGGTVEGIRVSAAQKPGCPDCGTPVFVLPANVYPVPVKPIKRETPPPLPQRESSPTSQNTNPSSKSRTPSKETQPTKPPPLPQIAPEGILDETPTRIVTPFRMIVALIGTIAFLTGWGLWHRQRIETAKAGVQAASEAGMAALKDGNFAMAARELSRARDAVDLLGRTDAESHSIRRHCREAVAGYELSGSSLFELLAAFSTDVSTGKLKGTRSLSRSRDSWLLIDAIVANPDEANNPCRLDIPLAFDGLRFRVEVDSVLIRKSAKREQSNGVARVIFAAQMIEIRHGTGHDAESVLVLNGKTAFLWTSFETYAALGYTEDQADEIEATRKLLASQLEQTDPPEQKGGTR
ncbi:MAG: hypothetical protein WCJ09_15580 [Planctomycetota bacterium]